MAVDFEAEGLLNDLTGERRTARERLLAELHEQGFTVKQLRQAVEQDRLALLPVERALAGEGPAYSRNEVAAEAGIEPELLDRVWRALGLAVPEDPDEPVFAAADVEAARRLRSLSDVGLPVDGMIEVARVVGMTMSQVAAASRNLAGSAIAEAGGDEFEAATRLTEMAEAIQLGPMLEHALNLHLREQVRRDAVFALAGPDGGASGTSLTVCFADLVGFTRLGERVPTAELGAVTRRFEELIDQVVSPPVRLVKLIGDAAMMVSREPDSLLAVALDLLEAADAAGDEFPELRIGLAHGEAMTRGGDWYGRPVNIASRLTGRARPGSVLVTADAREAATDEGSRYVWSDAGRMSLKGVTDRVHAYRLRRAPSGDHEDEA